MGKPNPILQQKIAAYITIKGFLTTCRMAALEITGYTMAIFLAETLVKICGHQ